MSPTAATKKNLDFDPNTFLATIGEGRRMVAVPKKRTIYAQGDEADAVFYIQKGKVRLTVVSKTGKEATIAIVNEGNFFGEGSLAGQVRRMGSAAAITPCELHRLCFPDTPGLVSNFEQNARANAGTRRRVCPQIPLYSAYTATRLG